MPQLGHCPFSRAELPSSAANDVPISSAGTVYGRRSRNEPSGRVTDFSEPTWTHSPVGSQMRARLWAPAAGAMARVAAMPTAAASRETRRLMGSPPRSLVSRGASASTATNVRGPRWCANPACLHLTGMLAPGSLSQPAFAEPPDDVGKRIDVDWLG